MFEQVGVTIAWPRGNMAVRIWMCNDVLVHCASSSMACLSRALLLSSARLPTGIIARFLRLRTDYEA
jgi:hypothetical protein